MLVPTVTINSAVCHTVPNSGDSQYVHLDPEWSRTFWELVYGSVNTDWSSSNNPIALLSDLPNHEFSSDRPVAARSPDGVVNRLRSGLFGGQLLGWMKSGTFVFRYQATLYFVRWDDVNYDAVHFWLLCKEYPTFSWKLSHILLYITVKTTWL